MVLAGIGESARNRGRHASLDPSPGASPHPDPEVAIFSAAEALGVPTDEALYARGDQGVHPSYLLNALEAQTHFASWLAERVDHRVSSLELRELLLSMHRISAVGLDGQRMYAGLDPASIEGMKPGQLRDKSPYSRGSGSRPEAMKYTRLVLEALGLGPAAEDGPLWVDGVEPGPMGPENVSNGALHFYPLGGPQGLRPYLSRAAVLLERVFLAGEAYLAAPGDLEADREKRSFLLQLGRYYHLLINAKPFEQINNSLLLGQVNVLLSFHGLEPRPHAWIDHIAHRTHVDTFAEVFVAHAEGRLPPPSSFGIRVRS